MKKFSLLLSFAFYLTLISCKGKNYNNHLMNDSTDSASLSSGKATADSATRLDATAPINNDSTGGQTGSMGNVPGKDTMGKKAGRGSDSVKAAQNK